MIPDGETEEELAASRARAEAEEFELGPKAQGEHLVAAQSLLHTMEA